MHAADACSREPGTSPSSPSRRCEQGAPHLFAAPITPRLHSIHSKVQPGSTWFCGSALFRNKNRGSHYSVAACCSSVLGALASTANHCVFPGGFHNIQSNALGFRSANVFLKENFFFARMWRVLAQRRHFAGSSSYRAALFLYAWCAAHNTATPARCAQPEYAHPVGATPRYLPPVAFVTIVQTAWQRGFRLLGAR